MDGWLWVRIGAVVGFLAVGMGAFGAHWLSDRLKALGTAANFETAAQYQMYHALALLAVGLLSLAGRTERAISVAGWGFLVGTLVFSGSLYILSLTGIKMARGDHPDRRGRVARRLAGPGHRVGEAFPAVIRARCRVPESESG